MNSSATEIPGVPGLSGDSPLLLPELIYRQLRHDIFNGVLQPGQILRQEELARRSKSSRVPLREALTRLEADGLIIQRPRRGYAVTSLEQADIVEIFELRMEIESHAGRIAAHARTPEDIRAIESLVHAMGKLNPAKSSQIDEWLRLNHAFHEALIASTRRKRLTRIASTLRDTVEGYIRVEVRMTGQVDEAQAEHRDIFEAFRAGDAESLADLCRDHVRHTQKRLLDGLSRKRLATRVKKSD